MVPVISVGAAQRYVSVDVGPSVWVAAVYAELSAGSISHVKCRLDYQPIITTCCW